MKDWIFVYTVTIIVLAVSGLLGFAMWADRNVKLWNLTITDRQFYSRQSMMTIPTSPFTGIVLTNTVSGVGWTYPSNGTK